MTASILFSFNTTMIVSTVRETDGEVKRYVNRLGRIYKIRNRENLLFMKCVGNFYVSRLEIPVSFFVVQTIK